MNDQEIKGKMDKAISFLDENLRKLRTGKANMSLLEGIKVGAYETTMPIEQLASVNVLDFKTIVIQPWDKSNVDGIMKAISASNLGMTPVKDSDIVRVSIPDLTEERRRELTKVVGTYEEETKIALRQIRKDVIESFRNDKEATEDDVKTVTEQMDKIIKEYNEKVVEMCEKKKSEMMEV